MGSIPQVYTAVALGIALSACCGFRVFVPLLVGAVAGHFGQYTVPSTMQWMTGWTPIICLGVASIVEIAAYYIPFIDNLLDTIATPLSVAAGTVLSASLLPMEGTDPLLRWGAGLIAGGAPAGIIQLGTSALRLLSSKFTAGTGNAVVATSENAAAVGGSVLALMAPLIIAVLMLGFVLWLLAKGYARVKRIGNKSSLRGKDPIA
jgi:uncharacterized membrane protein